MPKIKLTLKQQEAADWPAHEAAVTLAKANPGRALAALKRRTREALRRNLDPQWGDQGRCFPMWTPGMTTTEYVRRFQSLQSTRKVTFLHADRVAPSEDA